MNILIYLVTGVFVICSVLLILVVLIQKPRSEGLGAAFGGGMMDSFLGAGTTDVLTKATIWLAGIFFACTLGLAVLYAHSSSKKSVIEELQQQAPAVEEPAPAAPVTPPMDLPPVEAPATDAASGQ